MYDQYGESDLNYHELLTEFLQHLCERTRKGEPLTTTPAPAPVTPAAPTTPSTTTPAGGTAGGTTETSGASDGASAARYTAQAAATTTPSTPDRGR